MSLTEEERQAIVFYRLEKARQSLDETRKVSFGGMEYHCQ